MNNYVLLTGDGVIRECKSQSILRRIMHTEYNNKDSNQTIRDTLNKENFYEDTKNQIMLFIGKLHDNLELIKKFEASLNTN